MQPTRSGAIMKRCGRSALVNRTVIRMEYNYGFTPTELNRITAIVREHEAELLKAWHDYFNSSD